MSVLAAPPKLLHGLDMPDAPPLLAVRALGKSVPGPRRLFRHLDLEVGAGELVAIIGESGVGKSTLLNILAGLDEANGTGVEARASSKCGAIESSSRWKRLMSFHGVRQSPKSCLSRVTAVLSAASFVSGPTRVAI